MKAALTVAIMSALIGCGNRSATAAVTAKPAEKALLTQAGISTTGKVVAALHIVDRAGEHLLVLTEKTGLAHSGPDSGNGRTDLNASYYVRSAATWAREWEIKDAVDCPGLDHIAQFFTQQVAVTDLDGNGVAEVTVPYKMFCGGGVDEATLKIILRQGKQKFAMRGTTRIEIPGETPFGGEATYDKALNAPANAAFKKHIEGIRAKVFVQKYQ